MYAPYLVRADKWKEFFEGIGIGGADEDADEEGEGEGKKRPELETFQLRMSSRASSPSLFLGPLSGRTSTLPFVASTADDLLTYLRRAALDDNAHAGFNDESLSALVHHNPHVVHLQLSELGKLTSSSLSLLHPLARSPLLLRTLDLSRLGTPQGHVLVDEDLIALLATGLGAGLERLALDGNVLLTERSLTEGVRRYCHRLRELSLSDCEGIRGEGVEAMFTGKWPGEEEQEGVDDDGEDDDDVAMNDGGGEAEDGQQNGGAAGDATASATAAATAAVVVDDPTNDNNEEGIRSSQDQEAGGDRTRQGGGEAAEADDDEDSPLFEPGRPWRSPGLTLLNLHRLTSLQPSALSALLAHSAHSLEYLNLHSCDDLDADALVDMLAARARKVQILDVSFVRAVDNFVVRELLDRCEALRVLFLHGNNRVTSDVPRKVRAFLSLPPSLSLSPSARSLAHCGSSRNLVLTSIECVRLHAARRPPSRARECLLLRGAGRRALGTVT